MNKLRSLLSQIAEGDGDPQTLAAEALTLVDQLTTKDASGASKGSTEVVYSVEHGKNGETLAERRQGGNAQPFRCPKALYDALAEVLAESERAMPLDELVTAVGKVLGDDPADFQMRVPLRFWMQLEPPLVQRSRARYRAVHANDFRETADDLWAGLSKKL